MSSNESLYSIPKEIISIDKKLKDAGYESYLVGGCVRDIIRGNHPKDWDLTTNAKPDEITAQFEDSFCENKYGTVGILNRDTSQDSLKVVEITPYRSESTYSDNRRPDDVTFIGNVEDDLARRDFTVNAIAMKIEKKMGSKFSVAFIDPYGGILAISNKILRTVGEPHERFSEDALRMMRAVRLSAELGFVIDTETEDSIRKNSNLLAKISKERLKDELNRILMSKEPSKGIKKLHELELLKNIVPELLEGIGIDQNQAHSFDVWEHLLRTLDFTASKKMPIEIRLAGLFHDISKPKVRKYSKDTSDWTFYGHEVVGARVTDKILTRLKYPKDIKDKVVKLVRWHMFFSDTDQITKSAVRRIVSKVGKESVWDLMDLRMADRIGTGRPKENPYRLRKYKSMIEEVLRDPISVSMLDIDGKKIMKITGEKPGPKIGNILHIVLDEILDDPSLNKGSNLEKRVLELSQKTEDELETMGKIAKKRKDLEEEKEVGSIRKKYYVK